MRSEKCWWSSADSVALKPPLLLKHRLPVLHHRSDVITVVEAAIEDGEAERIEEVPMNGAFEGTGASSML